ncbi:MAG: BamA/TamA family outer membrane protein, partial [Acidobacteria bacterium]|nr:BamA/TamA family outer membrane protein [Acidobacteriota bacterium]
VILEVRLRETQPVLPALSIDVKDDEGLSIGPAFQFINLRGRGMKLSTAARFGGTTTAKFGFENPWYSGNRYPFEFDFHQRDRPNKVDAFQEISSEVGFRLGRHLGEAGRAGLMFRFLSLGSDTPGITLSPDNRDNVPTLGLCLGYDSRDLWSNPRRGWRGEVELARNGRFLGGDGNWWTFNLDVRRYQPLASRHVLALFSLNTLQTGEVGREIPVHLDFAVGGTNSIRGWERASGQGKNQFISTMEYRWTFWGPRSWSIRGFNADLGLQLALFGDAGMAWDGRGNSSGEGFIGGYGFGLRLLIPFVDVVRIDFAFGQAGTGIHRHIGLGEKAEEQRKRIR